MAMSKPCCNCGINIENRGRDQEFCLECGKLKRMVGIEKNKHKLKGKRYSTRLLELNML